MKIHFKNFRRIYYHFLIFVLISASITLFINSNIDSIGSIEVAGLILEKINISIIIVFSLMITVAIFKLYNLKRTFTVKLNTYGEYPMFIWRVIRYVFWYKKISIKHLPIYLQLSLINEGFFDIEEHYDSVEEDDAIKVDVKEIGDYSTDTVVFLIEDSYKINFDELPENSLKHTMVCFDRKGKEKNRRLYTKQMIIKVDKIINTLPKNINIVDLFMNTNPLTTLKLAKNCFFTGGRKRLRFRVYQYNIGVNWDGPVAEF